MAEEEVGLRLALKNRREVERGVDSVGDGLHRTGDEADRVNRKARIAAGGMLAFGKSGRLAGRAVVAGTGAAVAGLVGTGIILTKLSKDSIGEAREAQKVGAVTRSQIRATGGAANVSARQVGNLAGAISAKVGIDDEEIQAGANKILMYKNVQNQLGKGNKIFNRATRDAVDLSAVTGTLTTNSKLLGKVLNDPKKAITGLTKAGVRFSDQQIAQIKGFVKQGDLLSAQKIVLGQIEDRVGGVAAAQATWGEKASVSIGNIKESIGTALLPSLDKTEKWFVTKGTPVLNDWVGVFEKRGIPTIERYAGVFESRGIPAIRNFVDEGRPLVREILPAAGSFLGTAADAFGVIAPKAESVFKAFNGLPGWAKSAVAIGAGSAVAAKKLNLGSNIFSGVTAAKPLPVYVVNSGLPGGPGGKTKNGTPIITADERRGPRRRGRAAGRGVGGGLLAFLAMGNDDVSTITNDPFGELGKEILWPWKEGPFKPKKWTGDAREMKAAQGDLNRVFQVGAVRGDQYAMSLSGVSSALGGMPRDVRPRLSITGLDSALSKANSLNATLFGLSAPGTYGNGLGVKAPAPKKPKTKPRASFPSVKPPVADSDPFGRVGGDVIVHNYIDGQPVGDVVINHLGYRQARK